MIPRGRSSRPLAALFLFLTTLPLLGARYAVVIGVSQYARGIPSLEGPQYDAQSIERTLIDRWGFPAANVNMVLNGAATRVGILKAIDQLDATVQPGDFVFLYFSGHGTSWYQPGQRSSELDPTTGAILASDGALIYGNLDLQPRLRHIDERAQVFVVFDSCYSGSAVKSIVTGTPKYVDPDVIARDIPQAGGPQPGATSLDNRLLGQFGAFTARDQPYPYRHVIYFSAASVSEMAQDIPRARIAQGIRTVDGQPHGAMTNALLEGLAGSADTNHDGKITYNELYQYMRQTVPARFGHTPQMLYAPAMAADLANPVFSIQRTAPAAPVVATPAATPVRVRLEATDAELSQAVRSRPKLALTDGVFDLLVRLAGDGWELYHASGSLIQSYRRNEKNALIQRIAAEPAIRQLVDTQYGRQNFNLTLQVAPERQGFYKLGERLTFSLQPERPSYLLLLDIDIQGVVTILYPRTAQQAAVSASVTLQDQNEVTLPVGTEFLKAFAFTAKPEGYDSLLPSAGNTVREFPPTDPQFQRLIQMVQDDLAGRAQTKFKLVTSER